MSATAYPAELAQDQRHALFWELLKESGRLGLLPRVRLLFRSLVWAAYALPAYLLFLLAAQSFSRAADDGRLPATFDGLAAFLTRSMGRLEGLVPLLAAILLLLLLVNLPLVVNLYQRWRLGRRLSALGVAEALFVRPSGVWERLRRRLGKLVYLPPAFFLVVFLVRLARGPAADSGLWLRAAFALFLLVLLPGFLAALDRRLRYFELLRSVGEELQLAKWKNPLPLELTLRLRLLEGVLLLRDTAEAIAAPPASPPYLFRHVPEVRRFLRSLPREEQAGLEDLLDATLAELNERLAAGGDFGDRGAAHGHVLPGGGWEIRFRIAATEHVFDLVAICRRDVEEP